MLPTTLLSNQTQDSVELSLLLSFLSFGPCFQRIFLQIVLGWSGDAMILGKLPVQGRPTIWMIVGQGPTALAVGVGGGGLDILLSSIVSLLLLLPLSGRRPDID